MAAPEVLVFTFGKYEAGPYRGRPDDRSSDRGFPGLGVSMTCQCQPLIFSSDFNARFRN